MPRTWHTMDVDIHFKYMFCRKWMSNKRYMDVHGETFAGNIYVENTSYELNGWILDLVYGCTLRHIDVISTNLCCLGNILFKKLHVVFKFSSKREKIMKIILLRLKIIVEVQKQDTFAKNHILKRLFFFLERGRSQKEWCILP